MFISDVEVPIVLGLGGVVRLPQPTRQRSNPQPKTTTIATDVLNVVFILEVSLGLFRCRTLKVSDCDHRKPRLNPLVFSLSNGHVSKRTQSRCIGISSTAWFGFGLLKVVWNNIWLCYLYIDTVSNKTDQEY
jgi:hypothetical protein